MHGFDSRVIRIRWGRIKASTLSKKRQGGNNAEKERERKKKKGGFFQLQTIYIRSVSTGAYGISRPKAGTTTRHSLRSSLLFMHRHSTIAAIGRG